MKGYVLSLDYYEAQVLLTFIDSGANRPMDEVRRIYRLRAYFQERLGKYHRIFEDISHVTRTSAEKAALLPIVERRAALQSISQEENDAITALNKEYDGRTVALLFGEVDFDAIKKWWEHVATFPSRGPMADAVLRIDDLLASAELSDTADVTVEAA